MLKWIRQLWADKKATDARLEAGMTCSCCDNFFDMSDEYDDLGKCEIEEPINGHTSWQSAAGTCSKWLRRTERP